MGEIGDSELPCLVGASPRPRRLHPAQRRPSKPSPCSCCPVSSLSITIHSFVLSLFCVFFIDTIVIPSFSTCSVVAGRIDVLQEDSPRSESATFPGSDATPFSAPPQKTQYLENHQARQDDFRCLHPHDPFSDPVSVAPVAFLAPLACYNLNSPGRRNSRAVQTRPCCSSQQHPSPSCS